VKYKDYKKSLLYSSIWIGIIFVLHTTAMVYWEGHTIEDSLWLTVTTITTVGYGDVSINTHLGRAATVILMYIGGIYVLANTVADFFYYRAAKYRQQLHGEWRWNMNHHIVIISHHDDHMPDLYYKRLITEFRQIPAYKNIDIQILTNHFPEGLPRTLQELGVVHSKRTANLPEDLEAVNISSAVIVIVLARRHHDSNSDGTTFDILHRIRDVNQTAFILSECVDDVNRDRLHEAGANTTIRPVHAYPEMIVSVLNAPGAEIIIENMFTHDGDKYQRFDVAIKGQQWSKVVYRLMEENIGIAIAYITHDDKVHCNPPAKEMIHAKAIIAMVKSL
jgi:voltage-gated potassium channel